MTPSPARFDAAHTGARTRARRRAARRVAVAVLLAFWLAPDLAHADDAPRPAASEPTRVEADEPRPKAVVRKRRRRPLPPRERLEARDRSWAAGRLAILVGGGLAIAWAFRPRQDPRGRAVRLAVLATVGVTAYSSYYYFYQLQHRAGFDSWDSLYYYMSSKYADELGYTGLYEAVLLVYHESGRIKPEQLEYVRDLDTLRTYPPEGMVRRARRQRANFSDARWQAFEKDLDHFWPHVGPDGLRRILRDHGYNGSPVWSVMGHWVGRALPIGTDRFRAAVRLDRVLVAVALLAVAWAYGPAVGALAALVWGTGFLWRYGWGGDAFLRQAWFGSLLIGAALLRRRHDAAGGAALAFSALLRVFPGVFSVGYAAHAAREWWETRRLPAHAVRFVAGAVGAAVFLVTASLLTFERGPELYLGFFEKIVLFQGYESPNKIGLPVVLAALERAAPEESVLGTKVMQPARWASGTIRVLGWIVIATALFFFWRALRQSTPWEAALMAFVLIPLLSQPTNYYFSFTVCGVLLAERRPRIALWVVGACVLWAAVGLVQYRTELGYLIASFTSLALAAAVLAEMQRPASEPAAAT